MISITRLLLAFTVLFILRALYRITLHPLAKFPGPKLAAITNLYAFWFDVCSDKSLVKHLNALHEKYGPVVRVRPGELHVFDWDAYHTVFKHGHDFQRPAEFYSAPQVEGCFLNIPDGRVAKAHRDLFVQSFSKASVDQIAPLVQEKLALFLRRLQDFAKSQNTLDLDLAFNCLTADVTMHSCYQMDFSLCEEPNFRPKLITNIEEVANMVPFFWYFTNFGNFMNKMIFSLLPDSFVKSKFPAAASMKDMMTRCDELISSLAKAPHDSELVASSIFRTALNPNLEKGQYRASHKELSADAVLIFLAGTDTTAHALSFAVWGMMKRPELWKQLREELKQILPDTEAMVDAHDLERFKLLRAVAKEGIRASMGTSARLPRVVPDKGATLCGSKIPPKAWVSFSHYIYNNDSAVFPDPYSFKPERWLVDNTDELERHMISFSRGSRSCIGINLAYAELYTTLAHLVRRFDIVNDGTTDQDMDWRDTYTPRLKGHLKVKVRMA